jgi:uncharacterized membrane protein YsdA (DUF1294 family)/cold shock CspA family protein
MPASRQPVGRIVEWHRDLGYGYVEHDGGRVFLHVRDFSQRYGTPAVGDKVAFIYGKDAEGRTCAREARQLGGGGRLGVRQALLLVALLILPGLAIAHNASHLDLRYALGYLAAISLVTFLLYWSDKRRARTEASRIPESYLHLAEIAGGWPGAYVAQCWLRHKRSKASYQIFYWLIVALHQYAALDYLRGGAMTRQAIANVRSLFL